VDSSKEGLQFYEVVPVAMVAGTEMATGHRTMDTNLYFEGELIDPATNKPVVKVVRKGEGKSLANENTPMTIDTLKQVIDDMAIDAVKFDRRRNKPQQRRRPSGGRFYADRQRLVCGAGTTARDGQTSPDSPPESAPAR
jgi:hypothetical protein